MADDLIRVVERNGNWAVIRGDAVLSEHDSNRAAWRAVDRLESEPVSRQEETADWISRQILSRP